MRKTRPLFPEPCSSGPHGSSLRRAPRRAAGRGVSAPRPRGRGAGAQPCAGPYSPQRARSCSLTLQGLAGPPSAAPPTHRVCSGPTGPPRPALLVPGLSRGWEAPGVQPPAPGGSPHGQCRRQALRLNAPSVCRGPGALGCCLQRPRPWLTGGIQCGHRRLASRPPPLRARSGKFPQHRPTQPAADEHPGERLSPPDIPMSGPSRTPSHLPGTRLPGFAPFSPKGRRCP